MESFKRRWQQIPRPIRKLIIGICGGACIIAGLVMLVLPGPGWAAIFLGLAILATEFAAADRAKKYTEDKFKKAATAARDKINRSR